jgi:hypothetical protein
LKSANTLIEFRLFPLHYKPGWIIIAAPSGEYEGPENKKAAKLEDKLKNYKICAY